MAMVSSGSKDKKNLEVELNLMPVFDILSVCICFLLMTVVWVQVGALQTSQAIGGQSSAETPDRSSVWITINDNNDFEFSFREAQKARTSAVVKNSAGTPRWEQVRQRVSGLKDSVFTSAVILPSQKTKYDLVVKTMDELKAAGIKDVGISPL